MEHSGSRARAHTRTHTRAHSASARPRTVWVLVIKCITRLVYTESGPRNLQSRLVCRFNRTLLGTEFMARPMVYNSETRYTTARSGGSNTDGIFFRYLFSVRIFWILCPIEEFNKFPQNIVMIVVTIEEILSRTNDKNTWKEGIWKELEWIEGMNETGRILWWGEAAPWKRFDILNTDYSNQRYGFSIRFEGRKNLTETSRETGKTAVQLSGWKCQAFTTEGFLSPFGGWMLWTNERTSERNE